MDYSIYRLVSYPCKLSMVLVTAAESAHSRPIILLHVTSHFRFDGIVQGIHVPTNLVQDVLLSTYDIPHVY